MIKLSKLFPKTLFLSACVLLTLFTVGCSKSDNKTAKVLQVAISPSIPPFTFEENGQVVGVDLEIFKGFCESRGYTYNLKAYDFQGMLGAVASGQADVAFSGISITPKRQEVMEFSNPYVENGWDLVIANQKLLDRLSHRRCLYGLYGKRMGAAGNLSSEQNQTISISERSLNRP
jgi:polar amino acid transport system substrate-binding protein